MPPERDKPQVGDKVVLVAVPPGLFDELSDEHQRAISAIVGQSVQLTAWEGGKAVLDFPEATRNSRHFTIWVPPALPDSPSSSGNGSMGECG